MITKEKLKIYQSYKGDIDGWSRFAKGRQKEIFGDSDWSLIEGLIQDIKLVDRGLAANSYADDLITKLSTNCDYEETVVQLRDLASIF